MINLTESMVDSLALNSSAIKNGQGLVKKNSFPLLCQSEDGTLMFGECQGSGKTPYRCSVDWLNEGSPVFRCTCPSRQFPCKHNLGLMYSYTSGKVFETADIPEDIVEKRGKAEKREEKKKEQVDSDTPVTKKRKTNKAALVKKIAAQLEGINIAEKLMIQLVQSGLGSVDSKVLKTAEEQVKQLGNYYIPGVQIAFRDLTIQLSSDDDREKMYTNSMERLSTLQVLIKRSKEYLQGRLDDPYVAPDTETTIEEWIGHAWQIAELREAGRIRNDAELVQLAFRSYTDHARGEYVDEGYWSELTQGQVHLTRTYRPFRAAKYIREEDSVYQVVQVKELATYPGGLNARVRWEEGSFRELNSVDYEKIRAFAHKSFPEVIKIVKNQIKSPLADKHPLMLVQYEHIRQAGDSFVLLDAEGKEIPLEDIGALSEPTTHLLKLLRKSAMEQQVMLVMFEHNLEHNRLEAKPLTIVTANEMIRLLY